MRHAIGIVLALSILSACGGEPPEGNVNGSDARDDARQADGQPAAHGATAEDGSKIGTVVLATTCSEKVEDDLERGLALLHSMTYEESGTAFRAATETDPGCAMGYWGEAMTYVHPLWSDPPSEEDFQRGSELVELAHEHAATDREMAYVDALAAYYGAGRSDSETPNLVAFEEGWRTLHEALESSGLAYIDFTQLFLDASEPTYVPPHLNPPGNAIVAEAVQGWLREHD